jgi:hypothetical protein
VDRAVDHEVVLETGVHIGLRHGRDVLDDFVEQVGTD